MSAHALQLFASSLICRFGNSPSLLVLDLWASMNNSTRYTALVLLDTVPHSNLLAVEEKVQENWLVTE